VDDIEAASMGSHVAASSKCIEEVSNLGVLGSGPQLSDAIPELYRLLGDGPFPHATLVEQPFDHLAEPVRCCKRVSPYDRAGVLDRNPNFGWRVVGYMEEGEGWVCKPQ